MITQISTKGGSAYGGKMHLPAPASRQAGAGRDYTD